MSNRKLTSAARIAGRDSFLAELRGAIGRAPASWRATAGAHIWARVPASWVRYKITGRTVSGGRDMALPAAQYWPGGILPVGPVYAERAVLAPGELHRREAARCQRERDNGLCFAAIACGNKVARERWIDAAHAAEKAMLANLRLADRAGAEAAPAPVAAAPAPVAVFVLAIAADDGWRRDECYESEAQARRFMEAIAACADTQSVKLYEYATGRLLAEYVRPEPAPAPVAPVPAAPAPVTILPVKTPGEAKLAFLLTVIDDAMGARVEPYPTEAMARRAVRVLAGLHSTAELTLIAQPSGEILRRYIRQDGV